MDDFIKTTEDENLISEEEGTKVYAYLRKKYCNDSVSDLDIVLNSLCFALVQLTKTNISPKDYRMFCKVIMKILNSNLGIDDE